MTLTVSTAHDSGGRPPGELRLPSTLLYAGIPRVTVTSYSSTFVKGTVVQRLDQIPAAPTDGSILWVSVEGLADLGLFRFLEKHFRIHALAMEDALSRRHRPKIELHDEVTHFIGVDPLTGDASRREGIERVSIFLGKGWVLTIEDAPGDTFRNVHERLQREGSRLRTFGEDFLLEALIDTLVDRFFPVLDRISNRLDRLDHQVIAGTTRNLERDLHRVRKSLFRLREVAWPMKEAINALMVEDIPQMTERTRHYFRDVSDHLLQIIEHLDALRELATSIRDVHYSQMNMRMNDIMRNLAVLSAIFLPLTFIVGVYGMNFDFMPELKWEHGYYYCLGLILVVGVSAWVMFKRKSWV